MTLFRKEESLVTNNQINYWKLQEDRRSNRAQEGETVRHNTATEAETSRHNLETERETGRHNVATEDVSYRNLAENSRHNLESERFNISQLEESKRHNLSQEQISYAENIIDRYRADIQQAYNQAIIELKSKELNLAQEKELQRIIESKRDFDEAVRYHDVQGVINATNTGANAISKLSGVSGLLPITAGGVGAYGLSKSLLKSGTTKPPALPGPVAEYKQTSPHLWLIPEFVLELQKINTIGPTSGETSGLQRR